MKGYSKHFGVNKICAVLELRLLGYEISEDYLKQLMTDQIRQQQRVKEKAKSMKELQRQDNRFDNFEEAFCFIEWYNSNKVPYGLTWDELKHGPKAIEDHNDTMEVPF